MLTASSAILCITLFLLSVLVFYCDAEPHWYSPNRLPYMLPQADEFPEDRAGGRSIALPEEVEPEQRVCTASNEACRLVNYLFAHRSAAGNVGDVYDNRDECHACINYGSFLQLEFTQSGYGSQSSTDFDPHKVVIGNSSTAYTTGDRWSSQMRYLMLSEYFAEAVATQYRKNAHYWYPEHRDHDDKDHYHAAWPYVSSSQGSSGSELDELNATFYTLAAFSPETKSLLKQKGLIIPTLTMIARRARAETVAEYLSGYAHPNAFDNADVTTEMISIAHDMTPETIPPLAQIRVLRETFTTVEYRDERLFTTPSSVCRIFREEVFSKSMTVSARDSFDVNHLPLEYFWVVLRGDPDHVTLTPLTPDCDTVEIRIDYHPETTFIGSDGAERLTNLVEVGLFVFNGFYYSAPAFVTSFTLNDELRTYDDSGNLVGVEATDGYVHPDLK